MNLQDLLRHLQVEFPTLKWELVSANVDKSKAYAIKYQPDKHFRLNIEPLNTAEGVQWYSVNYWIGRNESGGYGPRNLKALDHTLVEYLNKYQPKTLRDGLQLSLFG